MDYVDCADTGGIDEAEAAARLRETRAGALALADGDEAYAVPLGHYYDGDGLYFRRGTAAGSRLRRFWEATERASYVVSETTPTEDAEELDDWSAANRERFDTAQMNRHSAPIRAFDEAVEAVENAEITVVELEPGAVTGRRTVSR